MMLGYEKSSGGIFLPLHGPEDKRPKKIKVAIRNGIVNPDGAIIMFGATIGASRDASEKIYRDHGYDPTFVETPDAEN